jgi:hypothetical protein
MTIRLYIVTYKRNDVLNRNLRTLWQSTHRPEELEVTVLANHPDVVIDPENARTNLQVKVNHTRSTHAWGYLARDWNYGILDAFGTWQNLRGTEWCVLAQNDVEWLDGWDDFLRAEDRFDMITQARGDQAIALNIDAVKKVGFFDERFTTLHFQELDYFIRSIFSLIDRVSINDDHPSVEPGQTVESSWNEIGSVLTKPTYQDAGQDDALHTLKTWHEMLNQLYHKWGVGDLNLLLDKRRLVEHASKHAMMPREVDWYPFFWDKMPGRTHLLLDQYHNFHRPGPPPAPPKKPIWKRFHRKLGNAIVKRAFKLSDRWHRKKGKDQVQPPVFNHPLNQPPSFHRKQRSVSQIRIHQSIEANDSKTTVDNQGRVLAVVQGPLFRRLGSASTFEVIERLTGSSQGEKIAVAVALWDSESRGDIRQIERLVDHVHVLKTPQRKGTCHRNWQAYAVASVLDAHKNDGFGHAFKCRSDMLLSNKYLEHVCQRAEEGFDKLCVTNLFTRYEAFHVSDMLVFSKYENLRHFFGDYELFYEDLYSPEVEYTRGYIRGLGLNYFHTLEDYFRFLKEQVELLDFEEMGLVWLKHPVLTPTFGNHLRPYMLDRDCGPWQAQLISKQFHEWLQKTSFRNVRRFALAMQVVDPILRRLLIKNPNIRQLPYFVDARSPEFTHTPQRRINSSQIMRHAA